MEGIETDKWLRQKWIAAGFATSAELARRLGTTVAAVRAWEDGRRPGWGYIQAIASAISAEPEEAVVHLWREQPGQPCPCGCGGLKVLPTRRKAYSLDISLPCQRCTKPRTYRWSGLIDARLRHRPLCPGCSHFKPRTTVRCVGYDDHSQARHAKKCRGTVELAPSEIREYHNRPRSYVAWGQGRHQVQQWQRPFLDEALGTYRCWPCALGSLSVAVMERRLRVVTGERIRSAQQRREVLTGTSTTFNPRFVRSHLEGSRRALTKLKKEGVPEHVRLARAKGALVQAWSSPPLRERVSRCVFCSKLVFTSPANTGNWHRSCLDDWYRSPAGKHYQRGNRPGEKGPIPLPPRRPGRPPGDPTRGFSWAMRHYFAGESFRTIAAMAGVDSKAVRVAIENTIQDLPPTELVPANYRLRLRLLREAAHN